MLDLVEDLSLLRKLATEGFLLVDDRPQTGQVEVVAVDWVLWQDHLTLCLVRLLLQALVLLHEPDLCLGELLQVARQVLASALRKFFECAHDDLELSRALASPTEVLQGPEEELLLVDRVNEEARLLLDALGVK